VLLLALGSFLCAFALILLFDALFKPAEERRASLRRVVSYAETHEPTRQPEEKRPSLIEMVVPVLSRIAIKVTPSAQTQQLEVRLAAAGAKKLKAQQFLALKTVGCVLGLVLGFAIGGLNIGGLLLAGLFVAAILILPDFLLVRAARERAQRLSAHLPQAIDQIAISLEAGLGFDAAVSHFVRRDRSPLAAELRVMLSEVRMGESRTAALKRLAERVPSDDVRNFVQTLVQSEGVGISRVAILRNQAEDLRQRRQMAAEERAQKAPVKMLFPIFFFILPVIFIVILGPAIKQTSTLFGGG
jgi:tight adherence protein C